MKCDSCSAEVRGDSRFCSSCGAPIGSLSQLPTGLATPSDVEAARRRASSSDPIGRLASSESIDAGGFAPGAVLGERYRIVGLVGRGGMGEVYRADDLKLGQPVALKFLPARLASRARLDRSLLRRGAACAADLAPQRLPRLRRRRDRRAALPLDGVRGRGRPRLAPSPNWAASRRQGDRDCAAALRRPRGGARPRRPAPGPEARQRHARRARPGADHRLRAGDPARRTRREDAEVGGTPAYMAPEQLAGKGASVQSDLYALGLVLYEVFTGQEGLRSSDPRRAGGASTPRISQPRLRASRRSSTRDRAGDPALPREGARTETPLRRGCRVGASRRRPAGGGARGGRNAVARNGRRRRQRRRDEARAAWTCLAAILGGIALVALPLSTGLPPRTRASGETAGGVWPNGRRRSCAGSGTPRSRPTPRGASPETASTAAGSKSTTSPRIDGRTWKTGVRRRSTSGTGRVPWCSSRSGSAATTREARCVTESDPSPWTGGMIGVQLDTARPPDPFRSRPDRGRPRPALPARLVDPLRGSRSRSRRSSPLREPKWPSPFVCRLARGVGRGQARARESAAACRGRGLPRPAGLLRAGGSLEPAAADADRARRALRRALD